MGPAAAVLGVLAVLTGLLPPDGALDVTRRVAPVLVFLVAVTVLAELADRAQVFDVAAVRAARLARGRTPLLFAAVLVLGAAVTVLLSLDTTAVLFTPVALALAARLELDPLPFAYAAVWLAGTASLLLPVSNLTNLLAADRLGLSAAAFAGRTAVAAATALLLTCLVLAVRHRRALRGRYAVPVALRPDDPVLCALCAAACLLLVPALLAGLPVAVAASVAAAVAVTATAVRRPRVLRPSLVPWRLLLLVEGLFLVVEAAGPHGLDAALTAVAGHGSGALGGLRVAAAGAVGANLLNNLPAYLALERVVPTQHVLDLLVGVDVGPLVTPWGSLATLLWLDRCRARGVVIRPRAFALAGLTVVPPVLVGSVLALHL